MNGLEKTWIIDLRIQHFKNFCMIVLRLKVLFVQVRKCSILVRTLRTGIDTARTVYVIAHSRPSVPHRQPIAHRLQGF